MLNHNSEAVTFAALLVRVRLVICLYCMKDCSPIRSETSGGTRSARSENCGGQIEMLPQQYQAARAWNHGGCKYYAVEQEYLSHSMGDKYYVVHLMIS